MTEDAVQPETTGLPPQDATLRRWKRWRWVSRLLLALVMLGTFGFAVVSYVLHQVLLPRIQEYKPQLEQRASALLGVPVRIGAIEPLTGGWIPSFELQQVELLEPGGATALRLPRVVAAVSARSLLWLGFEQVYVEGPVLDVRRDLQGRLWVAGLEIGRRTGAMNTGADWFFSQPEFVLQRGRIRWTDELKQAPSIELGDVSVVIRNPGVHHLLRLDATPPPEWGSRFTAMAQMKHGLLEPHEGDWMKWSGTIHVQFPHADVGELRKYGNLGINVRNGRGALRVWADVHHGEWASVVGDVDLRQVDVTLAEGLAPLTLSRLSGRLGGGSGAAGYEFYTERLEFETYDGVVWPGGNVRMSQKLKAHAGADTGTFDADKLDLATLALIGNRVPLSPKAHQWLLQMAPKGRVDVLHAAWMGDWSAPQTWTVKGRVSGVDVASQSGMAKLAEGASTNRAESIGRPGVRGLTAEFDMSQTGGRAKVAVVKGAVLTPGVFEDPSVPWDDLSAQVQWTVRGGDPDADLDIAVEQLSFSNADVQGGGHLRWRSSPGQGGTQGPGVLDLDIALTRADGARVYRYLPQGIPKPVRDYVQESVGSGRSDDVKIRVKGDLAQFPFTRGQGEFRIQAQIKDATYAFVPVRLAKEGAWPALTQLSGTLIFDRASMEVRNASSRVHGVRTLQTSKVQASIANLDQPVVQVQGDIRGALADMLDVVRAPALQQLTQGVLSASSGTGDASARLKLELPLSRLGSSKVEGTVTLAGNDVRISPDTPALQRARGAVSFTESGFQVQGAQARFLGGELKFEGGTPRKPGLAGAPPSASEPSVLLRGQGQATAQGLREARELGWVSQLARSAQGGFNYNVQLGFRRGKPELLVQSSLVGMALNLPAPLVKTADTPMALRYEQSVRKESLTGGSLQDLMTLDLGTLVNLDMVRDLGGPNPRVVRGTVLLGSGASAGMPMPVEGLSAKVVMDHLDLDAWEKALLPPGASVSSAAMVAYWPTLLQVRAPLLTVGGRQFRKVNADASREGANWKALLDAEEFKGKIEYHPAQGATPGYVNARLARLSLGSSVANDLESTLEDQPITVPALDIVVDDFEFKGRKLGRLEVDAINQGRGNTREWRLRKLNLIMPEAALQASGNWTRLGEQASAGNATAPAPVVAGRTRPVMRRTALKFKLEVQDSGALLKKMGMGELLRKTPGLLEGQIGWLGSPLALDYPSLQGQFVVDMKEGQFLRVDPGAARLLGVLSLQSLPRRLALDFRDVFSEGFAFDSIKGDVAIENGIARTNNLQMKGVVAGVLMEGTANIARETQDVHVVVVPEINAGSASLFAAAVNPIMGLGTFLAQAVLRRPLIKQNTQEFRIEGSWTDPRITKLETRTEAGSDAAMPEPAASAPPATKGANQ